MRRWAEPGRTSANQSGFTLLELIIVITLVIAAVPDRLVALMPLRGSAEAAHVATTVGTLRSALGMHVAERIVTDSLDAVAELDGGNPMQLLEQPPASYIGEVETSGADIPPGSWFFETQPGRLGIPGAPPPIPGRDPRPNRSTCTGGSAFAAAAKTTASGPSPSKPCTTGAGSHSTPKQN